MQENNLNNITLVFDSESTLSEIKITLNETQIPYIASTTKNQHGHWCIYISCRLACDNILSIVKHNNTASINLIELIVDNIRFGLVTFLCTTTGNQQGTEIRSAGKIDVELRTPIWQFWCDKMNSFNYKDYPLGSVD